MSDKYILTGIIIVLILLMLRSIYVDQQRLIGQSKAWEIRYELLAKEYIKSLDELDSTSSLISTLRSESEKMKAKIIADEITKNREGFKQ